MAYDFAIELVVAVAQFIVGLLFAMGGVYVALRLFDRFTGSMDEWKEMKKGNVAVGLLLGGIILSISIILESGVSSLTNAIVPGASVSALLMALIFGLANLLISIIAAVVSIYVAIKVLDWITTDIDEMAELKKGNVAVAIVMVAVLIAVSFVIRGAVNGITQLVSAENLSFWLSQLVKR